MVFMSGKKYLMKNGTGGGSDWRCRQSKKAGHSHDGSEKVGNLITASSRKQKSGKDGSGKSLEGKETQVLGRINTADILGENGACSVVDRLSLSPKDMRITYDELALDALFSPPYHIPRDAVGDILKRVDFLEVFSKEDDYLYEPSPTNNNSLDHPSESSILLDKKDRTQDMVTESTQIFSSDRNSSCQSMSYEASAIYLAMQQSRLECTDEPGEDSATEACAEGDDFDYEDEFDPYLFIRHLPDLSTLVPTFRPMLLPKQTRSCPTTTLVLDLDETLVHSSLEHCTDADFSFTVNFNLMQHIVFVRCRPYLRDFMERVSNLFEIIVFTASQSIYAEQLLNVLDPKRKLFRHRVFRESCVLVDGNYLKDLSVLGRDLARVAIIDNSPQAFGFQVDNGIPISSWFHDPSDCALPELLPFLESLVDVDDVRPIIAKRFNLREKVASAADPFIKLL